MRYICIILISIFISIGCSTLHSVLKAKEKGFGTKVEYDVNFEEAWLISKRSFRWAGTDAIEENKEGGYMLTSMGSNGFTDGSVMGAWIEAITDDKMLVTVISKRRNSLDLITGMTERRFHQLYNKGVNIIKNGEELPLTEP